MFTGIIEQRGEVRAAVPSPAGMRIEIAFEGADMLEIGGSIAVNGTCLTVIDTGNGGFAADVIPETLRRTNLGNLTAGDPVNIERPMAASGRFDGHMVQGHVDGIGVVEEMRSDPNGAVMRISVPDDLAHQIVMKGSVAVDGVSLTVSDVAKGEFSVSLIPHTLEITTLGLRRAGDAVNLETDMIAKYVARALEAVQ
jgi:riboflavin synthase